MRISGTTLEKKPTFERRHYTAIADLLAELRHRKRLSNDENLDIVVHMLGLLFLADNPRFSEATFRKACGMEKR